MKQKLDLDGMNLILCHVWRKKGWLYELKNTVVKHGGS